MYKEWMTTDYSKKINYKPEGRRNIGRPQTRWEDDFREEKNRPRGLSLINDDDDDESILKKYVFVPMGRFQLELIYL